MPGPVGRLPQEFNFTLDELVYRGNRLGHVDGDDPHTSRLSRDDLLNLCSETDVVLSNVIGFDVKVFEPDAFRYVVRSGSKRDDPVVGVLNPSDIGARLGVALDRLEAVSKGAFVDLGSRPASPPGERPVLLGPPHPRYREAVYETGTSRYDYDDVNDLGTNGVDDKPYFGDGDPNGVIDDAEEKTALPPYNVPLRGVKISIRVIDPNTKQVRQLSVVKSFAAQ